MYEVVFIDNDEKKEPHDLPKSMVRPMRRLDSLKTDEDYYVPCSEEEGKKLIKDNGKRVEINGIHAVVHTTSVPALDKKSYPVGYTMSYTVRLNTAHPLPHNEVSAQSKRLILRLLASQSVTR